MRRALLVGIDEYAFGPLTGCVADASAMRDLLERNADASPNFDSELLSGPPVTVTRALLRERIERLFEQPADVALFYFSGHGTVNNLGGYLVTQDASRYDEGVPMNDILALANQSPVREVVVILDTCHSGALGQLPVINNQAGLREGLSVLAASRAGESAVEAGGRGLFTTLVCDALDGGAADVLGNVTAAAVYGYVDQALGAWDQRPLLKSHVAKLTALRQDRPAVPLSELRQLPTWFPEPRAAMKLDPSFEPTTVGHDPDKAAVFEVLQRCRAAKLVEPIGEAHMYYAAINSRACQLTALGRYYWHLANEGRI